MDDKKAPAPVELSRRRFMTGAAVFLAGQLIPTAMIPCVLASGLPGNMKAALSAMLFSPIPFIFTLSSIAILGKPGFGYMKSVVFGWFRRRRRP